MNEAAGASEIKRKRGRPKGLKNSTTLKKKAKVHDSSTESVESQVKEEEEDSQAPFKSDSDLEQENNCQS
jgi:hypothetical protein